MCVKQAKKITSGNKKELINQAIMQLYKGEIIFVEGHEYVFENLSEHTLRG